MAYSSRRAARLPLPGADHRGPRCGVGRRHGRGLMRTQGPVSVTPRESRTARLVKVLLFNLLCLIASCLCTPELLAVWVEGVFAVEAVASWLADIVCLLGATAWMWLNLMAWGLSQSLAQAGGLELLPTVGELVTQTLTGT